MLAWNDVKRSFYKIEAKIFFKLYLILWTNAILKFQVPSQTVDRVTLESGIDVGQGITIGPGKLVKKNKRRAWNKRRA